ncbi:hypothetical protein SAMN05444359_13314 [Neolewinella agarilytica]|uniref:Lipoprotein n=1 Tax=Neolewinella agarilytica TaxID=478744 RepID=A0A1H9N1T7_9BACT|nr:hypothetical protein SAMN05444359_13314 [Neolewinella agarilytica]
MKTARFRYVLSLLSASLIAGCLYIISQEGSSLGLWLVIVSQCLLIIAMTLGQGRKGEKLPPVS